MGKIIINGRECSFTNERNVLEVIRNNGFNVPTLCYRKDLLKDFGACRLCMVEQVGRGLQASCTMPPKDGMEIKTDTAQIRKYRKTILELLIANHDKECTACDKSGHCDLQKYCLEYNVQPAGKYLPREEKLPVDYSSPALVRDANKCILCGACIRACDEYQDLRVLGFANRGSRTLAQPIAGKPLAETECIHCGQCAANCPTGAITPKSEVEEVWAALQNPAKKVVVQFAPAVRVAIGELFGFEPGENLTGKLNTALKWLGFDLVFDTNFSADLTIMEEGTELLSRLQSKENLPLFTSCCPGWVRFLELKHPDMLHHLSSCKSPQGMMGAIIRKYVPAQYNYNPEDVVSVSIMPCTGKKAEALREEFKNAEGKYEIDYVLTTQELGKMIKTAGINMKKIPESQADSPFGTYTGAGTIFGVSGGVAEAAARTAYVLATGEEMENIVINEMRGTQREKTVELDLKGTKLKVKIVNTIREAEKCIQEIKAGKADYQVLEVMACPGGCINGGGQPMSCNEPEAKELRAQGLYNDDAAKGQYRKSHLNPDIIKLYKEHLEKPNSHIAHELLHTTYSDKRKNCYISTGEKK